MERTKKISEDILKKIRHIEIYTRRLLSGSLIGDTRSAIKGTGFEFDQIREYQPGDDVRFIDWRASARMNKTLIKQYIEERTRTIMLAVDVSGSSFFGSSEQLRHDVLAQIASVLALVTEYSKDQVGLLLFSDEVEQYIPPSRGRHHIHTIMQTVFAYKPKYTRTSVKSALERLAKLKRKDTMAFVISDFIDEGFDRELGVAARMYDLIAIRCLENTEYQLPHVGFITVQDIETGEQYMLDTRKRGISWWGTNSSVNNFLQTRINEQNALFRKYAVDVLDINGTRPFIGDLIKFFARRIGY